MILLFLAAQAAAFPDDRLTRCRATLADDAVVAEREATAWRESGGGADADQCLALALAKQERWAAAAPAFEETAKGVVVGASTWWAAAGNAWLAAGEPAKAVTALDAALAGDVLGGLPRGEALLDRARARVAAGDTAKARSDLNEALTLASDDPLAWLLSATLARRDRDLPRAATDIAQALTRSPDDASVQLEAGNIAAAKGDAAAAKAAWTRAAVLAPQADAGRAAQRALTQFVEAPTPAPEPK